MRDLLWTLRRTSNKTTNTNKTKLLLYLPAELKPVRRKGGPTRTRAHAQARNLPSPEALSPDIEKCAVNQHPLQALFLLPRGGSRTGTGPGTISIKPTDYTRGVGLLWNSRPLAVAIGRLIVHGSTKKRRRNHTVQRPYFSFLRGRPTLQLRQEVHLDQKTL